MNVESSNSLDTSALLRMIEQYQQKTGVPSTDAPPHLSADKMAPPVETVSVVQDVASLPALGRYINVFA